MNQSFAIERGGSIPLNIAFGDSGSVDAFGRARVSQPQTLFEVQCQYNSEALRMETGNTADGVAPAYSTATRMVTLQINAGAAGGSSFIQSFEYVSYQPGKSQLITMTGVMGLATAGAVKRFGYGDSLNGIFYEQNGTGGLRFNRRTSTSGATVDNTVDQAAWNIDPMNGLGPSGKTLDPANCFILVIDLQFLGMGRVRVGFDIGGVIYYAHQFLNANVLTVPYMQSASLPVMAEIIAAAGLAGVATSNFKCAGVASEGGFEIANIGRDFSVENNVTALTTRTDVLSLRPKTTFNTLPTRGFIILEGLEIMAGTNAILWELCIGVAFTVAPTWADVNTTYSFVERGINGTFNNLAAGVVIASGYVAGAAGVQRSVHSADIATSYPITLNRAGNQRALGTLTLLLTSLTAPNSACRAAMNWREVR